MQNVDDVQNTFSRSWNLLSNNWAMLVPGIVIGIVAGVASGLVALMAIGAIGSTEALSSGQATGTAIATGILYGLFASSIGTLAAILTLTVTAGMAAAAWQRGTATFADGMAVFARDGARVIVTVVLLFLVSIVAAFLLPFTFGLSMLAFCIFFLYTIPAVIVGGLSATDAMSASWRLSTQNFVPTLLIVLIIVVMTLVGVWVSAIFHFIPFIGPIIGLLIGQAVLAYAAIVVVGEYNRLRNPVSVTVPPPPAAPAA